MRPSAVIGVAGGSGSGKTTVVRRIVESLGPEHATVLDHADLIVPEGGHNAVAIDMLLTLIRSLSQH